MVRSWGALAQLSLLLSQDHLSLGWTLERRNVKLRGNKTTHISETWDFVAGKRPKERGPVFACLGPGSSPFSVTTLLCDLRQVTFPLCAWTSSSV